MGNKELNSELCSYSTLKNKIYVVSIAHTYLQDHQNLHDRILKVQADVCEEVPVENKECMSLADGGSPMGLAELSIMCVAEVSIVSGESKAGQTECTTCTISSVCMCTLYTVQSDKVKSSTVWRYSR